MPMPTIELKDVTNRYEAGHDALLAEFSSTYLETKIQDTVDTAYARWGALIQARLDEGSLTPNLYKKTIAEAVLRVVRNPEGYSTEQEGNYQYSLRRDVAAGYLFFSPDDVLTLIGVAETQSVIGTFTIGLGI